MTPIQPPLLVLALGCALGCGGFKSVEIPAKKAAGPRAPSVESYRLPEGSRVLGIDSQGRKAILGREDPPEILILDLPSGKLVSEESSFVPRVALEFWEDGVFAVFGHGPYGKRARPTSEFVLIRQGVVSRHRLTEPIAVQHGIFWRQRDRIVLNDEGSSTLVFIDHGQLLKFPAFDPRRKVPVARLVLKDQPFDFRPISRRLMAISFREREFIAIADIMAGEVVGIQKYDRSGTPALLASFEGRGLFASVEGESLALKLYLVSERFRQFYRVEGRATEALGLSADALGDAQDRRPPAILLAAMEDALIWLGVGRKLLAYKVDVVPGEPALQLSRATGVPVLRIDRVDLFKGGSKIAVSSYRDGKMVVYDVDALLH